MQRHQRPYCVEPIWVSGRRRWYRWREWADWESKQETKLEKVIENAGGRVAKDCESQLRMGTVTERCIQTLVQSTRCVFGSATHRLNYEQCDQADDNSNLKPILPHFKPRWTRGDFLLVINWYDVRLIRCAGLLNNFFRRHETVIEKEPLVVLH